MKHDLFSLIDWHKNTYLQYCWEKSLRTIVKYYTVIINRIVSYSIWRNYYKKSSILMDGNIFSYGNLPWSMSLMAYMFYITMKYGFYFICYKTYHTIYRNFSYSLIQHGVQFFIPKFSVWVLKSKTRSSDFSKFLI